MPRCQYCDRNIEKFETDICPYCGQKNPIPPNYKTMDFTKNIAKIDGKDIALYKSKSQTVYALLCLFLGFLGAHNWYIKKPTLAAVDISITIVVLGGLGSILCFATPLRGFGYLIAFTALFLGFACLAFILKRKDSPKDGDGEFLR